MQCIINNEPETTAIQARLFTRHVSSVGESKNSTKYSDKKKKNEPTKTCTPHEPQPSQNHHTAPHQYVLDQQDQSWN